MHGALTLAQYIATHRATVVADALTALAFADAKALQPLAHRLSGTLASYSLSGPASRARELETVLRDGADDDTRARAVDELRRALEAEDGR